MTMHDYNSLHLVVAVMICASLVNTHTHTNTQTDSFLPAILLVQPPELKISTRQDFLLL